MGRFWFRCKIFSKIICVIDTCRADLQKSLIFFVKKFGRLKKTYYICIVNKKKRWKRHKLAA